MLRNNLRFNHLFLLLMLSGILAMAQPETNQWKFQFGLGVNGPIDNQKNDAFEFKTLNFPSINLGVQHMFARTFGAKLDFGYNRARNSDDSPEFKLNYTRINLQLVYDFYNTLSFLPSKMTAVAHLGPGLSISKPLGNYSENKYTHMNALGGMEFHYGIAPTVSVFTDISYAMGLSSKDKYDPDVDGFSFNGDIFFITIGVSVSLSGCYFCD